MMDDESNVLKVVKEIKLEFKFVNICFSSSKDILNKTTNVIENHNVHRTKLRISIKKYKE